MWSNVLTPFRKDNAPQIEDWGCRQGWRRVSEPQDVSESLSCHEVTEGAAMQSIAVDGPTAIGSWKEEYF